MKSLYKALDLLEYIILQDGRPVTPSELAENCNVNITSCVRMVKTFTERGYLIQVSRRDGYIGGPALVTASAYDSVYYRMRQAAPSPIGRLSRRLGCMVNLSIIHNDRRYLLYVCGQTQKYHVYPVFSKPWDYLNNATERLLLSACDAATRHRIIQKIGLPEGISSYDELMHQLDAYKKAQSVAFFSETFKRWIIGGLMLADGYPPAAIAFNVKSESEVSPAIEQALNCVKEIEAGLTLNTGLIC